MNTALQISTAGPAVSSGWVGSSTDQGGAQGPSFIAQAGTSLSAAGKWLWQALEASGRQRASRHLMLAAQHWDHFEPARAAELRAAARHNYQA